MSLVLGRVPVRPAGTPTKGWRCEPLNVIESKTCRKCDLVLPLDAFYRDNTHSTGYQRACKGCQDRRRWPLVTERKQRAKMPMEAVRAQNRARYVRSRQANPEYHRIRDRRLASLRRARLAQADVREVTQRDLDRLVARYRGLCAYCPEPWSQWDHVVPLCRGGRHAIGNLLPSCRRCNYSKHHRLLVEWNPS